MGAHILCIIALRHVDWSHTETCPPLPPLPLQSQSEDLAAIFYGLATGHWAEDVGGGDGGAQDQSSPACGTQGALDTQVGGCHQRHKSTEEPDTKDMYPSSIPYVCV